MITKPRKAMKSLKLLSPGPDQPHALASWKPADGIQEHMLICLINKRQYSEVSKWTIPLPPQVKEKMGSSMKEIL